LNNYYDLLGVKREASAQEIKKAFRDKAKRLHPDVAGKNAEDAMRKLLAAYEVLSNPERRFEYDRVYSRFTVKAGFNYRVWLNEQKDDPVSQSKLVFFELLHLEGDEAIKIWRRNGGIDFPMEKFLDREDWMDCLYMLAEELDRQGSAHESFKLLVTLIKEEKKLPYFRHFLPEIETYLKEMVRLRLKAQVSREVWIECLEILLTLGFSSRDEYRWLRFLAQALADIGDTSGAEQVIGRSVKYGKPLKLRKVKA